MQFASGGPDVPDDLLQAHEDGRVVFFCGAGISYPAGLPGFDGLVDAIYRKSGAVMEEIEKAAYDRYQFDAVLGLLERRIAGKRHAVRKTLLDVLRPQLNREGATDTHKSLLQLARSREGSLRLVTTNFDRVFEHLLTAAEPCVPTYAAPLLPVPKKSRWNGLVYLHGLLPQDASDESALNRLVLTSGDFGLAYLVERWAARFVSDLFSEYMVCFVGYSISDPVLRYMMDALAADRELGESTPQAYAFADCVEGCEKHKTIEWQAKGVTPILYRVSNGAKDHDSLHNTLKAWAGTYRDGVLGKERIVTEYALTRPAASTLQDDFVGRMLWALSDKSGLPARRLAEFDPAPSLDWLEALSANRFRRGDLSRFGVSPGPDVGSQIEFSLLSRPAPYTHSPRMAPVSAQRIECQWDDVMIHLASWLLRYLGEPQLVLWLAARGGRLHERLAWMIERQLDKLAALERDEKTDELAMIRAKSPHAVPDAPLRAAWRLLLNNRVSSPHTGNGITQWIDCLKRDGLTATLRFQLRELLAPRVHLTKAFDWTGAWGDTPADEQPKPRIDFELELASDHVYSWYRGLANEHEWHRVLPLLLDDFQRVLRDSLDLLCEVGEADDHHDESEWHLPSISPHSQNRSFRDWVALIELLRDAWTSLLSTDPVRCRKMAHEWFTIQYPTFKRLALFAASSGCIESDDWVNWLLADDARCLWSPGIKREALRLLVLQGKHLTTQAQERLEAAILKGPPPAMFPFLEGAHRTAFAEHLVWLRLAKLRQSVKHMGVEANQQLTAISTAHPDWQIASDEKDEFSQWMSVTGDPGFRVNDSRDIAPREPDALARWLKRPQSRDLYYSDNWRATCADNMKLCANALVAVAADGEWPANRWNTALSVWSDENYALASWQNLAPSLAEVPEGVLGQIANSIAFWLEAVSKAKPGDEDRFFDLCRRILNLPSKEHVDAGRPLTRALNHPIGHVAQSLLNLWYNREPSDNDLLPRDVVPFFTQLCDKSVARFRHGRILLASNLISLYRVDRDWTAEHLLPFLDWKADVIEARAAWEGFLWSPRLYWPLLVAFKSQFLETARHYNELAEMARQYAAILTYAALDPVESYTTVDFRDAVASLPEPGLLEVSHSLVQALQGANEQREEYWTNRVQPLWRDIWPKSGNLASKGIAENLARLAIAARHKFSECLDAVYDWLQPLDYPHVPVHELQESGLAAQFPSDALRLLDRIIGDPTWPLSDLRECLNDIAGAAPTLRNDPRFQRLDLYLRRHGL